MSSNPPATLARAARPAGSIRARTLLLFALLNGIAALGVSQLYVLAGPPLASLRGVAFASLALTGQIGLILLLLMALAAIPSAIRRTAFLTRPLAATAGTLLLLLLLLDTTVFSLYRFHVNALVLNVLTTSGGFASMQLPRWQVAASVAAAFGLLLCEWWAFGRIGRHVAGRSSLFPRPWAAWSAVIGIVVTAGVAERLLYVTATLSGDQVVPRLARIVPFYQPVSIRKLLAARGRSEQDFSPPPMEAPRGLLDYPRRPLEGTVSSEAPSLLWIVLDGWRADLLDPETTPEIWRFSQKAQLFRRHQSGGNATRTGIFTMFYGLHGTYWQPVLTERRGPVLVDALDRAGYRLKVLASAPLDYPEFRKTVFATIPEAVEDAIPGDSWWRKDEEVVSRFGTFLSGLQAPERFFAFLFLDATHNPFESPEDRRPFQPAAAEIDWLKIRARREIPELFNRYRNAVHWDDELVGRALRFLERRGRLESTIVVITSDHGHGFYERGYFGYNGAFTPEEVDVPLLLSVPGLEPRAHEHRTAHQDLPGTLLRLLGVGDDASGYTLGRDLFDPGPRPFSLSCGFTECALRDDDGWLVFGTDNQALTRFEARDRDYAEVEDSSSAVRARAASISEALDEMRRFLR